MTASKRRPNVLARECPSRTALRHLTDRWTPLIVAALEKGEFVRFTEIKNTVQGISPKVLTETLRSMERDGLVLRRVTPSIPPRVDYRLTELGCTTVPPLKALREWAEEHIAVIEENRDSYDRASGK
ncbi:MAG: helix-turn-helix domain-containing protein [Corynebacterium sp.]|nr:helix-turn-helix domain-containing protein [Corynebacterium sp.]